MTVILLATGDEVHVDGPLDEVVKALENAARSSAGTLARLVRSSDGEPIAINANHVVLVRAAGDQPDGAAPAR